MIIHRRTWRILAAGAIAITMGLASCGGNTDSSADTISGNDAVENAENLLSDENDCIAAASSYNVLVQSLAVGVSNPSSFDKAKWLESVDKARKVVPNELAADFDTLAVAYGKAADALEGVSDVDMSDPQSYTNPDYLTALQTAGEILDAPDIKAINERLTKYFTEECG